MERKQSDPFHPSDSLKPVRHQLYDSFRCLPNIEHDFPKQLQHQRKLSKVFDVRSTQIQKILCCCGNYLTIGPFFPQVYQLEEKENAHSRSESIQSEIVTRQEELVLTEISTEKVLPQESQTLSHELQIGQSSSNSSQITPIVTPIDPVIPSHEADVAEGVRPADDMISASQKNSSDRIHVKVEKDDIVSSRKFVPHQPHPTFGKSHTVRKKHDKSRADNAIHRNNHPSGSRDRNQRDKGRKGGSLEPSHDRRGEVEGWKGKRKSSDEIISRDPQQVKTARDNGWLGLVLNEFLQSSSQEIVE